jgi:hypothetical protein
MKIRLKDLAIGAERVHALRNPFDGQAVVRMKHGDRRARHRRYRSLLRSLNETCAPVLLDRLQPLGSIAISTTEDDGHDTVAMGFSSGHEQGVGCGTGEVHLRPSIQADAVTLQKHVMVRRRHIDVSGSDQHAVLSKFCRKPVGADQ